MNIEAQDDDITLSNIKTFYKGTQLKLHGVIIYPQQ